MSAVESLVETYGNDPSAVGAVDGTEDDFGDLMADAWATFNLPKPEEQEDLWDHFQDVAVASRATRMEDWYAELEAVVAIYRSGS